MVYRLNGKYFPTRSEYEVYLNESKRLENRIYTGWVKICLNIFKYLNKEDNRSKLIEDLNQLKNINPTLDIIRVNGKDIIENSNLTIKDNIIVVEFNDGSILSYH